MADETKTIRIVVDATRAVEGSRSATAALERMEKAQQQVASSLDRMEQALGRVGFWLKGQLIVMATDLAGRLVQMAKQSFEAAAGLGELAEQLGITARSLQGMQFAAAQAGVGTEQLETAISKFNQKIGEAAAGSKPMLDALNALNVKILDANGKLRPTEQLLQNVAERIVAIEDPAKRAAASVDFFGKSGAKMQTVLADMAKGLDGMAIAAKNSGAMISDSAIAKLDKLADAGEKSKLQMRALFAESAAEPLTQALDLVHRKMENIAGIAKLATKDISTFLTVASNLPFFAGLAMGKTPSEQIAGDIAKAQSGITSVQQDLAVPGLDARRRGILEGELTKYQSQLEAAQRAQNVRNVGGKVLGDGETGGLPLVASKPGKSNPPPSGGGGGSGGETPEEKYAKLTIKLQEAARAQDIMTEAARRGDVAFEEAKVHVDAVQKVLEIFGKRLEDNDPRLVELEARMLRIARGQLAQAFNVATTELENQNKILEKQIELMNEAPEIQAKELALIKAKNEAEKAGTGLKAEDIQRREQAIEQNEKLKLQQDELKKAQELWTEPLKQALRDIQTIGADAFEQLLESGKFSFEGLAQTFGKIIRRMAAEFLALATIRPVMSVMVNSIGGEGLARQLGVSGGGGFGGLGMGGGTGFGGGSLFGGGGFLGDIGDWLNTPMTGAYAGMSPSSMAGVPMLSPSMMNPASWGITPLAGIGAAAGAGMGIMQLINGGGSTKSTIGGISSIVGAAASLIPGVGPFLGAGISLLGNILPGLFGGDEGPKLPPLAGASQGFTFDPISKTFGGYGSTQNGGQSLGGMYDWVPSNIEQLYQKIGGNPTKGGYSTGVWQNYREGQTTVYLVSPNGNTNQFWQGGGNSVPYIEKAGVEAFRRTVLEGWEGADPNFMKALAGSSQSTFQELHDLVAEIQAFDDAIEQLGKTTSSVDAALAQIDAQFAALYATASKYGLGTDSIDAAKQAERLKYATNFADSIQRGINDFADPNINKLADLDKWRTDSIEANNAILKNVTGSLDQINNIEQLYALQRKQIVEDGASQTADALKRLTEQSVASIQAAIERLTLGDLANLSPTAAYTGQRASYTAMLAQARAGDSNALAGIAAAGTSLADVGRSYFASGPEYEALRQQIVSDLSSLIGVSPTTAGTNSTNDNIAQLAGLVQTLTTENQALRADVQRLVDLLSRQVVNQ